MSQIFSDIPDIIDNNLLIAKKCNYFPVEINPRLPKFSIDSEVTESELLNEKSHLGLKKDLKKIILNLMNLMKKD